MEKFIEGTDNKYSVTDDGEIYSFISGRRKKMKPSTISSGHKQLCLIYTEGRKFKLVHRLVAQAFLPDYSDELTVNHIDHNKENNNLSNLNIMTYEANVTYEAKCMRMNKKLTAEQVRDIKRQLGTVSQAYLAKFYGVSEVTINHIKKGITWTRIQP